MRLLVVVLLVGTVADLAIDLYAAGAAADGAANATSPCEDIGEATDCFCCCADLIVQHPIVLAVSFRVHAAVHQNASDAAPSGVSEAPFHPPKA